MISLAIAGRLDLLRLLYGTLILPKAVHREIVEDGAGLPGAAEIEGSRVVEAIPEGEVDRLEELPESLRRIADRAGARATFLVPVRLDGQVAAVLELHRASGPFSASERDAARVAAGQAGLVLRAHADGGAGGLSGSALMLTAEALAAGGDELRGAERIARLAADATGASGCVIWRTGVDGLQVLARTGVADDESARPIADAVFEARASGHDDLGDSTVASFPVGQPPMGVLQLFFRCGSLLLLLGQRF